MSELTLRDKVDEFSDEAKAFLMNDLMLMNLTNETIGKIKEVIRTAYEEGEYKIKIHVSKDMEVPDWEELVVSIGVMEESFDKILRLWDAIAEKAEAVTRGMKVKGREEVIELDRARAILSIDVDRYENV
mgnify:FL=1